MFMDGGLRDSIYWDPRWDKKDKPIMDVLNIQSHDDMVLNPRHHMYYQGIKMVNFEFEFIRKLIRNIASDHVDFIMYNATNNDLIKDFVTIDISDGSVRFIPTEKYAKIAGEFEYVPTDARYVDLKTRFSREQIEKASNSPAFKIYFKDYVAR